MESQTTRRMLQKVNIQEPTEFISARTDTKIKLGYLFIHNPRKLEMFGLRQVSSRHLKFTQEKPSCELPPNQTSKSLLHKTESIESKQYKKNLSKLILNKSCQEQLILSNPTQVLEEKKEQITQHKKNLQSHHCRQRQELPPILANSNLSPLPFDTNQVKKERKQKILGKIYLGRQTKFYKKQTEQNSQKNFIEQLSFECPNVKMLLKNQNLKRSKQISLSQAVKELKKNQELENKGNKIQIFKSHEKELISLILGNDQEWEI